MVDRVEVAIIDEQQPRWLSFLNGRIDHVAVPGDYGDLMQASLGQGLTFLLAFICLLGAGFGFVLAVFECQAHAPVGRCVTLELVGHHNPWCLCMLSQQFAHEPLSGLSVAPALYKYVQDVAMLINRPP